jgi:hypothetical protein
MSDSSSTPTGVSGAGPVGAGRRGDFMKRPYTPPRIERLMDTNCGTGKQFHSHESTDSAGPRGPLLDAS